MHGDKTGRLNIIEITKMIFNKCLIYHISCKTFNSILTIYIHSLISLKISPYYRCLLFSTAKKLKYGPIINIVYMLFLTLRSS